MKSSSQKKHKGPTEWSRAIETLRRSLNLSQAELGKRLETSAMAVSRWERGESQPPADGYIRLGKLSGDPLCWFFWGRAGLNTADVIRVLPKVRRRFLDDRSTRLQVVHAGAKRKSQNEAFVAIPLLPVWAATPGQQGDRVSDLDQLKPEAMVAAPADWCPHPSSTISLRVKGNSMSPLILDGYIVAVDTSSDAVDDLVGQIVVASNTEKGLLVSRLIKFDHTHVLVSDHREFDSVALIGPSGWRIIGRVLWWTGKAR
jgi:phage repressor protein C with HTH and peptisase S24 domain/DNA-binding XRE family transcriptional regulator